MHLPSLMPFWKSTPTNLNRKNPFLSLHSEVNRLFEDFFQDRLPSVSEIEGEFLSPNIDLVERENLYEITAELPGVEEKDVEVSVVNNELLIYTTKKIEKKQDKENYHLRECTQGSFSRSLPLPYDADANVINASMKNGVLKIEIGKTPESADKVKKIPIKGG